MYQGVGGSKRRYASVGDIIVISVKDAIPKGKVKKGAVHKAVVVRTRKEIQPKDYKILDSLKWKNRFYHSK